MTQILAEKQKEDTAIPENVWESFAADALKAYEAPPSTEQSMAAVLRPAIHQLYNSIVEDPFFRDQFLQCPEPANGDTPTWSSTLYESENIRAGLLSVYRDKPVPFHDHPGAIGVTLVLSGVTRIEYANIIGNQEGHSLAELEMTRVRDRLPGQVCWFFEHDRNIHSVESKTPNAVLLVIHMPHIESEKQNMYFPVADYQLEEGEKFMANRVKIKRSQKKSDYV